MAASASSRWVSKFISRVTQRLDSPCPLPSGSNPISGFSRPKFLGLNKSSEFFRVKTTGRSAVGAYFRISATRAPDVPAAGTQGQPDPPESRVGIITTRRIGNAVLRARCRRRIRELHRLNRRQIEPGYWIVAIAKTDCATAAWKNLETEWLRLLGKLSILRNS
jgi:ribonuclease P protein component